MKKPRKKKDKSQGQSPHEASHSTSSSAPHAQAVVREADDDDVSDEPLPESAEPTFSKMALPMVIIPLLGILVYFADMYLIDNSGKFSAMVYDPNQNLPVPPGGPSLFEHGRFVYDNKAKCTQCHQMDGSGNPAVGAPPLAGSDWVLAEGPNRLIRLVLHGLTGPLTVNGKSYNATMLAWKDSLTDEDIAAVLTFIRQNWGNKASSVTPEEVKAIRDAEAKRNINWTGPELLKIPEK